VARAKFRAGRCGSAEHNVLVLARDLNRH
jgi:hypothetical protein